MNQPERLTLRQRIWGWWTLRKLRQLPAYRVALDEGVKPILS